jgi:hypothetical protein
MSEYLNDSERIDALEERMAELELAQIPTPPRIRLNTSGNGNWWVQCAHCYEWRQITDPAVILFYCSRCIAWEVWKDNNVDYS